VPPLFSGLIREERLPINVEPRLLRRWGTFAQENLLLTHSKSTLSASLASLVVEATQSRSPRPGATTGRFQEISRWIPVFQPSPSRSLGFLSDFLSHPLSLRHPP
jgi:hypothetical protein